MCAAESSGGWRELSGETLDLKNNKEKSVENVLLGSTRALIDGRCSRVVYTLEFVDDGRANAPRHEEIPRVSLFLLARYGEAIKYWWDIEVFPRIEVNHDFILMSVE